LALPGIFTAFTVTNSPPAILQIQRKSINEVDTRSARPKVMGESNEEDGHSHLIFENPFP
jgi:hypothetical protein